MKPKRSLLIIFLVLTVVSLALWLWQISESKTDNQPPTTSTNRTQTIFNQQVSFSATYSNNTWTYFGSVQLPNPCTKLTDDAIVMESFPEQVQVRLITTSDPGAVCAQVITSKSYSGKFAASEQAKISVFLNGEVVR